MCHGSAEGGGEYNAPEKYYRSGKFGVKWTLKNLLDEGFPKGWSRVILIPDTGARATWQINVWYIYRVVFLTGPPDFQYQNEKQVAANQD